MLSLGQLKHLPPSLAASPFHPLIAKFSRYKTGSFEALFTAEAFLLRYSWLGLIILMALVLPPLEEVDVLSTIIRLSTLLYPALFIWSLTRISGVELMQLMLEGRWIAEILASPQKNRDLTLGFVTPIWLVVRQYFLITLFSLALYDLETHVIVRIEGHIYWDDILRALLVNVIFFFSAVSWIVFIYMSRLLLEVRLRNGLLKGLFTLALILSGAALFIAYGILFFFYPEHLDDPRVLAFFGILMAAMAAASLLFHWLLRQNFRYWLAGQLDLDPLIYDVIDPHASAWEK